MDEQTSSRFDLIDEKLMKFDEIFNQISVHMGITNVRLNNIEHFIEEIKLNNGKQDDRLCVAEKDITRINSVLRICAGVIIIGVPVLISVV